MLTLPDNYICRPYRGVSVQHWDAPLDEASVKEVLLAREAYRRTEFIVLRGGGGATALVAVTCAGQEALFNPVIAVEWLAGPDECAYVVRHDVDSANATALAQVAEAEGNTAAVYVVEGRYQHVNFIVRANPVEVRLIDVVPPDRPRLVDLAQQAITIDEDLPPIRLVTELIDIRQMAAAEPPGSHFLLPCQGAGLDLPGKVDYLDQRPERAGWTLIGCERSRQFHQWFYGEVPERRVELCPDRLVAAGWGPVTVLRCCLIERGLRVEGERAVIPWGTNLSEVQRALRILTGVEPVTAAERSS
jgi:hypothetical protein